MDRGSQLDEEDEERTRRRKAGGVEEEEEEERKEATLIKSNNPHLAGGEQPTKSPTLKGRLDHTNPRNILVQV